jgi:DNA-binding SARP family transcriptional activator
MVADESITGSDMTSPQLRAVTNDHPGRQQTRPTRVTVLGALSVDGSPPLSRSSHRRLLAILLLADNRRASVDALVDRFWAGAAPKTARGAIHTHVSALRHALPTGMIVTIGDAYCVNVRDTIVDRDEFMARLDTAQDDARSQRWHQAFRHAASALELWTGDPFPDLARDPFAMAEIARLEECRLQAVELRAASLMHLGRAGEALADLEWATRTFPLRESLSTLLALARQETGGHADALRSLRSTVRALAELGLEPSPALRDLEQQILMHRRTIDATAALAAAHRQPA